MIFVNMFGDSVDPTKHKPKKRETRGFAPTHSGWVVKGSSPDEYARDVAYREHLIKSIKRENADNNTRRDVPDSLPPFFEWAKSNRNHRPSTKHFSSAAVALECKRLAEKNGWINVEVIEVKRGDESQLKDGFIWR